MQKRLHHALIIVLLGLFLKYHKGFFVCKSATLKTKGEVNFYALSEKLLYSYLKLKNGRVEYEREYEGAFWIL